MIRRCRSFGVALVLAGALLNVCTTVAAPNTVPNRLSNREFWRMVTEFSEAAGSFRSDNLVSNESRYQAIIPDLVRLVRPGGVYLGVGPEQNFTYLAALRPKLAFIVDVRKGNADLHLMYKALFELSGDRADFVARLFSRARPARLGAASTGAEIFAAFQAVEPSERLFTENMATIRHHLVTTRGFPLTAADLARIESIAHVFFLAGPRIQYSPYGSFGGTVQPTYADLMTATDNAGQARSYLWNESGFAFVRDLQRRNAIVPIVGDFAGARAIRAMGGYVRRRGGTVGAFYVSNVEEYLRQNRVWQDFCANVASLPVDGAGTLVRAVRGDIVDPAITGFTMRLAPIEAEFRQCGEK